MTDSSHRIIDLAISFEEASAWQALFARAEERIKQVERSNEGLDIPAVNELRYVGYHLLELLISDKAQQQDQKTKVVSHLHRAIYDACEALISFQLEEVKSFQEDYRLVIITDVVTDYLELLKQADAAKALLTGTKRGRESREHYYEKALEHVEELEQINAKLRLARDELNKKLEQSRSNSLRWLISIIIALFTGLLALITLIR